MLDEKKKKTELMRELLFWFKNMWEGSPNMKNHPWKYQELFFLKLTLDALPLHTTLILYSIVIAT